MSIAYETYKSVGNKKYGKMICEPAPCFSSRNPQFAKLTPGYGEVHMKNRREIQNHPGSIHTASHVIMNIR